MSRGAPEAARGRMLEVGEGCSTVGCGWEMLAKRGRDHFASSWGEGGATRALGKCAARCEGRGQVSYLS